MCGLVDLGVFNSLMVRMDYRLSSQNITNLKEEELDEEIRNCVKQMNHPQEAFYKAKVIKDEGNKWFRKGNFGQAIITYEKAYQFLSVGEPLHDQDVNFMMDLATSLSLNLAACGFKVDDLDKTIIFSSFALDFNPENVKALFRRAVVFVKVDRLDDALKDLKHAVELDPNNQEVRKELRKIEEVLGNTPIQFKEDEGKPANLECQVFNPHTEASYEDCNNVHDTNLCP